MSLVTIEKLTPEVCQKNPDVLFVFGDNMQGQGRGGQAIIRDEANAIGLPTKVSPDMLRGAFFTNHDLPEVKKAAASRIGVLVTHVLEGKVVAWPTDGIGTGLAQLPKRAPAVMEFYNGVRAMLYFLGK